MKLKINVNVTNKNKEFAFLFHEYGGPYSSLNTAMFIKSTS